MISLFENFDRACEITVFPQPKAPGIAVVPPWTHLHVVSVSEFCNGLSYKSLTGIKHPKYVDRSEVGNLPSVFQPQDEVHGQAKAASWYAWKFSPQIRFPARYP